MPRQRENLEDIPSDELLQRAIASSRVGDMDDARTLLAEVTRREPQNAEAWLWRAGVEGNPQTKRAYFETVLALRPDDPEARAGLARLAEKYGAGVLAADTEVETLVCTWHPDRPTLLRCNRCGRPMCTECAVQHPVGLRCKECVKETRPPMYKVTPGGYLVGAVVGLVASTLAALPVLLLGLLPWIGWLIVAFIAAGLGTAIAEVVSRAAGRKRGPGLQLVVAGTMVAGVVVVLLWRAGGSPAGAWGAFLYYLIPMLIYLFIGIGAAVARLR